MKKKKSGFSRFLSVIGTILLIIVLLAAALYLVLRFWKIPLDDSEMYRSMPSTGPGQHLSFSEDADMTVSFDKSDIWYFIYGKHGENYLDELNRNLSEYDLEIRRCGFVLDDEITAGAELFYKFIRIPVTISASAGCENDEIFITPKSVKLAFVNLPIDKIISMTGADARDISYFYKPELTFIKSLKGVRTSDGKFSVTGPMATAVFPPDSFLEGRAEIMGLSTKSGNLIGPVVCNSCDDPKEMFSAVLPLFIEDPSKYTDMLDQFFTACSHAFRNYDTRNFGMLYRWYPDYSIEKFEGGKNASFEDYYLVFRILKSMDDFFVTAQSRKDFKVVDGELTYKGSPFSAKECYGDFYTTFSAAFDLENSRVCFLSRDGRYPALSSIADSEKNIREGADMKTKCAAGLLTKGTDGRDYAVAFTDDGYEIIPLVNESAKEQIMYPCP